MTILEVKTVKFDGCAPGKFERKNKCRVNGGCVNPEIELDIWKGLASREAAPGVIPHASTD